MTADALPARSLSRCGSSRLLVTHVRKPCVGLVVRYRKCSTPGCGGRLVFGIARLRLAPGSSLHRCPRAVASV